MPTPHRLHYHVVADHVDGTFTTEAPAAARKQQRLLTHQGRQAHVYQCSTAEPACPLTTGEEPSRSSDDPIDP
jgi:hypothetical protein